MFTNPKLQPLSTRAVRFWMYVGSKKVYITLHPGKELAWGSGGPDEEGYSYSYCFLTLEEDGVRLVRRHGGVDCDGKIDHIDEYVCPLTDIAALNRKLEEQVSFTLDDSKNYDYNAIAAGY